MEILGDEVGHWRWVMTSGVVREDMGTTGSRAVWVSYLQSSGTMIPWEILEAWQEAPGFGIFAAVVLTCFSQPDFPHYVPRPQFWSGQAYFMTLCVRSLCTLFFRGAHGSDTVPSLRWDVDFGLLNNVETVGTFKCWTWVLSKLYWMYFALGDARMCVLNMKCVLGGLRSLNTVFSVGDVMLI